MLSFIGVLATAPPMRPHRQISRFQARVSRSARRREDAYGCRVTPTARVALAVAPMRRLGAAPRRCRSSAIPRSSNCCATTPTDPARGGARQAEHPDGHHQQSSFNAFVADGRRIFVNDGAMMQSETPNQIIGCWRTRPAISPAAICRSFASSWRQAQTADDHRHAARRRRDGSRRGGQRRRRRQAGRGGWREEVIPRTLLAPARQQKTRRPRRGEALTDRPSAQACTRRSSASPTRSCSTTRGRTPYLQSHPMPAKRVAREGGAGRVRTGTRRRIRRCNAPRHDARQGSGFMERPTPSRALPASDTSLAARYARAI